MVFRSVMIEKVRLLSSGFDGWRLFKLVLFVLLFLWYCLGDYYFFWWCWFWILGRVSLILGHLWGCRGWSSLWVLMRGGVCLVCWWMGGWGWMSLLFVSVWWGRFVVRDCWVFGLFGVGRLFFFVEVFVYSWWFGWLGVLMGCGSGVIEWSFCLVDGGCNCSGVFLLDRFEGCVFVFFCIVGLLWPFVSSKLRCSSSFVVSWGSGVWVVGSEW